MKWNKVILEKRLRSDWSDLSGGINKQMLYQQGESPLEITKLRKQEMKNAICKKETW